MSAAFVFRLNYRMPVSPRITFTFQPGFGAFALPAFSRWGAIESASRRRAGAALWRAAKAEGLAHSTTLRAIEGLSGSRVLIRASTGGRASNNGAQANGLGIGSTRGGAL